MTDAHAGGLRRSGTAPEDPGSRSGTGDTFLEPTAAWEDAKVEERADRFDDLYGRYHRLVLAYFLRRLVDREAAHDAAADVFVVIWRRIGTVPHGDGERPWIYGVCRNVLSNHERTTRRRTRLSARLGSVSPAAGDGDPVHRIVAGSEEADLRSALARLGPEDREVLRLATWERLPHAEIGEVFGVSTHAVDQRIHRASRRLAEQMARLGYDTTSPGEGA